MPNSDAITANYEEQIKLLKQICDLSDRMIKDRDELISKQQKMLEDNSKITFTLLKNI